MYFAVKSFPGQENRKSSMMSPGLPPVACLLSGSGRSALLTVNLPQTEILTCQICYLYKGRLLVLLSAWYTSSYSWTPDSWALIPLPGLAFCSPALDICLVTWTPLTWSFGLIHPWLPSMTDLHSQKPWCLALGCISHDTLYNLLQVHYYPLNIDLAYASINVLVVFIL